MSDEEVPEPTESMGVGPLARYSTVGIEMVVSMVIGIMGGRWLDEQFGTEPYLFFVGMIAGIGAAAKPIVRMVRISRH